MPAIDGNWLHGLGIAGLVAVFVIGTWRAINLGALALVLVFLIGVLLMGQGVGDVLRGFPVDLLILLSGVTYLFGVASRNGTIECLMGAAKRLIGDRRGLVPWIVFAFAAIPTSAGALGSAGVALIAPMALNLAERCALDRRMMALMVLHGAACGNYSPLNALGVIVLQTADSMAVPLSPLELFAANVAYNVALAAGIYWYFRSAGRKQAAQPASTVPVEDSNGMRLAPVHRITLAVIAAVAIAALVFSLNIGFLALTAAVLLQVAFPTASAGAERRIAWDVILLVCGIVTYVGVLQRFGTVDLVGAGIAALQSPLWSALLLCAVAALTSAFASSAGILGAMTVIAMPFITVGGVDTAGFLIALAISSTVVDASPFSTAGALVVANVAEGERARVYRALLWWAAAMVVTAPLASWALFVLD